MRRRCHRPEPEPGHRGDGSYWVLLPQPDDDMRRVQRALLNPTDKRTKANGREQSPPGAH